MRGSGDKTGAPASSDNEETAIMAHAGTTDIQHFIDTHRFSRFQRNIDPLLPGGAGRRVCVSGSQVGAHALAAAFYPTGNRATGVSWASAVGRSGSVPGSMAGGLLLTMQFTNQSIFQMVAVPALISAAAVSALGWHRRRRIIPSVGAIHTA
jgi:hypothetical protein